MVSSTAEDVLVRSLSHPTRRKVLRILSRRVASPSEMAAELRLPVGALSHHVRWLAAHDCITLVRTAQRRGAVEHYYRATSHPVLTDEQWRRVSARRRGSLAETMLRDLWNDLLDARDAETLTADDVHLTRTLLTLDDQGHRELSELLLSAVLRGLEIEADSIKRLDGADGRRTELGVVHFDRGS